MDAGRMATRKTVSREELFRQVWEMPMSRLAEGYGVTGNGLAKICDRLLIPYPPRGYGPRRRPARKSFSTGCRPRRPTRRRL